MQADTEHSIDMAEQVRELAYELWLKEGQPEGREEEFWLRAEQRLRAAESPPPVETEPADEHDETAAQSFPASDPPSSTPAASTVATAQQMPEKKRRKA